MSATDSKSIKKEDRLFSLILALLASRDGLTKSDILSTVRGYAQSSAQTNQDSLEKMFERDKSELREMGVVIDTVEPFGEEGETHNIRYVVTHRNFDFPENIEFTPAELTLLQTASQAWQLGSLSADSRHALTKLRSLGLAPTGGLIGVAPRISTYDRAFDVVSNALRNELILEFSYLKPGDNSATSRKAAPLAVVSYAGLWMMLAFDLDAGAQRTFLLRRIVGDIRHQAQKTYPRPVENYAAQLISELDSLAEKNIALIHISPGSDAYIRLSQRAHLREADQFHFHYTDIDIFADEIVAFGNQVTVLAPELLVDKVTKRLNLIAESVGLSHG